MTNQKPMCRICEKPVQHEDAELCNQCWEMERGWENISKSNPEAAQKWLMAKTKDLQYEVTLQRIGRKHFGALKVIRNAPVGLGLKEAKWVVDGVVAGTPHTFTVDSSDAADQFAKDLAEVGCKAFIKPAGRR
jgi:ribosomal protein L7/L12